jgi:hypothetical protein
MKATVALLLALAACGGGPASKGTSAGTGAEGSVADRPLVPLEACPVHYDTAGVASHATQVVPAGETSTCGVVGPVMPLAPAPGYVGCCYATGRDMVVPIPGGPADPCVTPAAPGYAPTPNCIEVAYQPTPDVCGTGGTLNQGDIGGQTDVSCCCY